MDGTEAQTQQEIAHVVPIVEELTGLPSRWSGRVELVPDAEFRGKKLFSCAILLDAAIAPRPVRWRTLIHEALHSVSAGYIRADYDALIGWEAGTVEQLQRLLRRQVLNRLSVDVPEGGAWRQRLTIPSTPTSALWKTCEMYWKHRRPTSTFAY